MTRVTFYLGQGVSDPTPYVARLLFRLQARRRHAVVCAPSDMALELGALEGSRLARASWDALPQAGYYAVCEEAGHVAEGIAWHHTLINIGQQVPPGFSRFEEVWEWVGDDIESGRERYRYYRDRGYPLQHDHSLVAENWTQ